MTGYRRLDERAILLYIFRSTILLVDFIFLVVLLLLYFLEEKMDAVQVQSDSVECIDNKENEG